MVRGNESAMATRKRRSVQVGYESDSGGDEAAALRPTKLGAREVVERGLSPLQGFRKGNIVSVRMKSFVTFEDAVIMPTPRLNLIVGPNGSGKSTVVSAVCICLGGKLGLLGRSAELAQYVRHGCQTAEVEVRMFDPDASGGTRCVRRVFGGAGGKTVAFYVDGKKAKMSDVEAVRGRYDVQLDNLAQFMPQEKIAEFCNQGEGDLLVRTVRALGGTSMAVKYDELCDMDLRIENGDGEVEKKEMTLGELVEKNKALEADVRAYEELQELKKTVRRCEKFVPHVKLIGTQEEFRELKDDYKVYEATVLKKREEAAAKKGPLVEIERSHARAYKNWHDVERPRTRTLDKEAAEACNQLEDMAAEVDAVYDNLKAQEKAADRKRKDIEKLETKLDEVQRRWEAACQAGDDAEAESAIVALNEERRSLRQEKQEATRRKMSAERDFRDISRSITHLTERGKGLLDVRTRRLRQLEAQDRSGKLRGLGKLTQWVQENAGRFRGKVHGPIAVEIDCENQYFGRILTQCIPGWALAAFVVECKEDGDRLRKEARQETGVRVTTMSVPLNSSGEWDIHATHHPRRPVDERLRSLGIESCVSEIYGAPEPVKAALHAQFQFQHMHVGTEKADRCMEQLVNERGMACWFTPQRVYNCRTSRYNRSARSTAVADLRAEAGLFGERADGAERERAEIHAKLQEEEAMLRGAQEALSSISEEVKRIDRKDGELAGETAKHQHAINGRKSLKREVANIKRRITTAKSDNTAKSIARKRAELWKQLKGHEAKLSQITKDVASAMGASVRSMAKYDEALAIVSAIDRELKEEQRKNEDTDRELGHLEDTLAELKNRVGDTRRRLKKEKEAAYKSVGEEELDGEFKDFYAALAELSLDDLEAKIMVLREKASRMTNTGGGVVRQFEENQRKIEGIRRDLEEFRATHERRCATFNAEKREFTEWLFKVMDGMANKFSELFQGLGCRGDIRLSNADSVRLADLKIEIMVSFRDDVDLRPVSQNSNSGGEKMATTMLYCFALQAQEENRNPPFVIIDELNQGLDPKNERYIMSLMMRQAEMESTPQSFVVTPKLIMRLPFGQSTSCHIIMNGLVNVPDVLQTRSS